MGKADLNRPRLVVASRQVGKSGLKKIATIKRQDVKQPLEGIRDGWGRRDRGNYQKEIKEKEKKNW